LNTKFVQVLLVCIKSVFRFSKVRKLVIMLFYGLKSLVLSTFVTSEEWAILGNNDELGAEEAP